MINLGYTYEYQYRYYVVQVGDNAIDVARKTHRSINDLSYLNRINFFKKPVFYKQKIIIRKFVSPKSKKIQKLLKTAKSYLGTRYKWGGESKRGIDCSGLTLRSYKSIGITLERVSRDQYSEHLGHRFKKFKDVRVGDLIFFSTRGHFIGHVGIVIDPKKHLFIQASSGAHKVVISRYDIGQYRRRFRGFKRIIK